MADTTKTTSVDVNQDILSLFAENSDVNRK